MPDRCIVSCCFAPHSPEYYAKFADRLEASLDHFGQDADRIIWRKSFPPQSPMHQSLTYAFKWYAVKDAFDKGYRYVMWLDAGTQAIAPIEPLWEHISKLGYALLRGCDPLYKWISDAALNHFSFTRDQVMDIPLAGGCLIGLDQQNETAMKFFGEWSKIVKVPYLMTGANRRIGDDGKGVMRSLLRADADDSVISLDPRVEGHRSDEACFSLICNRLGMEMLNYTDWQKVCRTY